MIEVYRLEKGVSHHPKNLYKPLTMEPIIAILTVGTPVAGGLVYMAKEVLSKFAEVIKLLTTLEQQNRVLEEHLSEAVSSVKELRQHDVLSDQRLSDLERYLQLYTQTTETPFVIRYGKP